MPECYIDTMLINMHETCKVSATRSQPHTTGNLTKVKAIPIPRPLSLRNAMLLRSQPVVKLLLLHADDSKLHDH